MISPELGRWRLLRLATHLRNRVDPLLLRMEGWKCGSVACAAGHACDIPEFRDAGLHLEWIFAGETYVPHQAILAYADPESGATWAYYAAVSEFFGISDATAKTYFAPSFLYADCACPYKPTPQEVADRLEELARNLGREETPLQPVSSKFNSVVFTPIEFTPAEELVPATSC